VFAESSHERKLLAACIRSAIDGQTPMCATLLVPECASSMRILAFGSSIYLCRAPVAQGLSPPPC
jgi:hypothetical protein